MAHEYNNETVAERDGIELCEDMHVHPHTVEQVHDQLPDEEAMQDLAEAFKVFGDTTRIRILYVLYKSEMCVCDIAQILGMTVSAISHQLRILKQARLVKCRRDKKTVYYSLLDRHVEHILNLGMEHVEEQYQSHFKGDDIHG